MPTRRAFLAGGAALASGVGLPAGLLAAIDRAVALSSGRTGGTLMDVEHVVILMQENRSFDHYLGSLGGVRGYNDRITVPPRQGRTVWEQSDGMGVAISPFILDGQRTASQHVASLPHSWDDAHSALNRGRMDNWVTAKGPMTMAAHDRRGLSFHYALADAFTVCDSYHCSVASSTNPNRLFLFSGTLDSIGRGGGPVFRQPLEDGHFHLRSDRRFSWTTYPERLEEAGVDWRFYQGLDTDGPYMFDPQDAIAPRGGSRLAETDSRVSSFNPMRFFKAYDEADSASPLYQKAMRHRPPSAFAADARSGRLPAVSWLFPPQSASEHPKWTPAHGAVFIASALNALTANPETWRRTAMFVLYDENDGFFDHVPPPTPPASRDEGLSNVDIAGEIRAEDGLPFGLGPRVPAFVVSPWSRGGAVCSEVFDHTSMIRFLEARFGVREPNISAWRRAVCGDLISVFDFSGSDRSRPRLPDTADFIASAEAQASLIPATVPDAQIFPTQEVARRLYRPLPYDLEVELVSIDSTAVRVSFVNQGMSGAVFQVFDELRDVAPKRYTVASGTQISEDWMTPDGSHDLYILGPAGFLRHYRGTGNEIELRLQKQPGVLRLIALNHGNRTHRLTLADLAYSAAPKETVIGPGRVGKVDWQVSKTDNWYDFDVTSDMAGEFRQRFAGHVEGHRGDRSDPALTRSWWSRQQV